MHLFYYDSLFFLLICLVFFCHVKMHLKMFFHLNSWTVLSWKSRERMRKNKKSETMFFDRLKPYPWWGFICLPIFSLSFSLTLYVYNAISVQLFFFFFCMRLLNWDRKRIFWTTELHLKKKRSVNTMQTETKASRKNRIKIQIKLHFFLLFSSKTLENLQCRLNNGY